MATKKRPARTTTSGARKTAAAKLRDDRMTAGRATPPARKATATKPLPTRAATAAKPPAKRAAASGAKSPAKHATAPVENTGRHPLNIPKTKAEERAIARLRTICMALPDVTEKIAWGEPTWRAPKIFAQMETHHHGVERVAVWLPARSGVQEALVDEDPEHYFRPPYVGVKGWVGVRIDNGPDWRAVAGLVAEAYREVASARALAKLDAAAPKADDHGWRAAWLDDEPEP